MERSGSIAIIGAGASGSICAYFLQKAGQDVTLFDKGSPLRTLLPTGGGRCNLAHSEYDFKELAKNYPRGEKFLYSVFSKFATVDTIELFEELGIKTYTQDDGRIFPESNSARDVREKILKHLHNIKREEVNEIKPIDGGFVVKTEKAEYFFDKVIVAVGGHSGYDLLTSMDINVIHPHPALVGLNTKENFKELSGIKLDNCISLDLSTLCESSALLFTHFGISGPLVYKISSLKAFDEFPYELNFDLCPNLVDLQSDLNSSPHKEIKNILCAYLPQKVVSFILRGLNETAKAHTIDGKTRDIILKRIHNFKVTVTGTNKGEETVTAGGVDLSEINSKTMEVKKVKNLYCIGEVLNIDGFCGGFNLQNAWSTAYIAAQAVLSNQ